MQLYTVIKDLYHHSSSPWYLCHDCPANSLMLSIGHLLNRHFHLDIFSVMLNLTFLIFILFQDLGLFGRKRKASTSLTDDEGWFPIALVPDALGLDHQQDVHSVYFQLC